MAAAIRHTFRIRRALLSVLAVGAGAYVVAREARWNATRPHFVYLTGWVLFGLILFLTAYNVRKKLAALPLVSSTVWLQAHLYLGLLTGFAFLVHLQWHWPSGRFEVLLTLLFVLVEISGILGWWLSRHLPRRLTTAGGEVPYERIPVVLRTLRTEAERLVLGVVPMAKATTLAEFYTYRLVPYFAGPANFSRHLFNSHRPLNTLLAEISDLKRFANEEESKSADALAKLVRQKDALDFHRALQLTLKVWLFVHIPLTYALLLLTGAHLMLVYGFSGGAR